MKTVQRQPDGAYRVVDDEGNVVAFGLTNREAWRAADRANDEAISKSEDTADWVFSQMVHNASR